MARVIATAVRLSVWTKCVLLLRLFHQITDDLADPFVVKYDGDYAGACVQANSVAHDDGVWMVHLDAVAIDQRDREWPERPPVLESQHCLVKGRQLHCKSPKLVHAFTPNDTEATYQSGGVESNFCLADTSPEDGCQSTRLRFGLVFHPIRSIPIHFLSTSGMTMLPSGCW